MQAILNYFRLGSIETIFSPSVGYFVAKIDRFFVISDHNVKQFVILS